MTGQDLDPNYRACDAESVGAGLTFIEPPHDGTLGITITTPRVLSLRAQEWVDIRATAIWILTHPDRLHHDNTVTLRDVQAACPHLDATARHVRAFAAMMTNLTGTQLPAWIDQVRQDDLPHLRQFADGLHHDYAAGLVHPVELGPGRRPEHQSQADQTHGLRPRQLRPAPQAHPLTELNMPSQDQR